MGPQLACSSDELSNVGHAQPLCALARTGTSSYLVSSLPVDKACFHCPSCRGFISILPSCFSPQPFPSSSLLLGTQICSRCLLNLPELPVPSIFLILSRCPGTFMFSRFAQVLHSFSERANVFPGIICKFRLIMASQELLLPPSEVF